MKIMLLPKRTYAWYLIIVLLLSAIIPNSVKASNENSLKDNLLYAASLLKEFLNEEYAQTDEKAHSIMRNSAYDYDMSEEYYEKENENVLLTSQINEIIAAYSVIKANNPDIRINEIELFQIDKESAIEQQIEPVKYAKYKEIDGILTYERDLYTSKQLSIPCVKNIDGTFVADGEETITPQEIDVPFLKIKIHVKTGQELLDSQHLTDEIYSEDFRRRLDLLENSISNKGLVESFFIRLPQVVEPINIPETTPVRLRLIQTALSLLGQVPYEWGGKSRMAGYDPLWWTIKDNGKQKGLDCSGFVHWAYRTAGFYPEVYTGLYSTGEILRTQSMISREEVQPGDLGLLNMGETTNHVGIYVGDDKWVHCSSSKGTVVVSNMNFKYFYRVIDDKNYQVDKNLQEYIPNILWDVLPLPKDKESFDSTDIDTLYKTVWHEARGEGINGWVAVAEVILNRVRSDLFPNTINEVIYSPNQFAGSDEIASMTPSEECKQVVNMVLDQKLSVLNNESVMYFRRSDKTGNWGNFPFYKQINHHKFYLQE